MATDPTTTPDLATQCARLVEAAEHAPTVLPGPLGAAAAAWLRTEASCHRGTPDAARATEDLVTVVSRSASTWATVTLSTLSTLGEAVAFAEAVLALPLSAPAAAEVPGLRDRYGHTWMLLPGETDSWWSQCKGIVLSRAAIDAEAGPLDDVDVQVPPMPAPATVDRDAAVLAELRRMFDDAFPDDDYDYHYSSERLVDLVRDRIEKLEAAVPAVPAADDQERRRIAQVLHDVHCGCDDWDAHESEDDDPSYLLMADAAIAALREVPDA